MFNRRTCLKDFSRAAFLSLLFLSAGCAAMQPQPAAVTSGQPVLVDYTCELANGQIVATTSAAVGEAADMAKSPIFAAPEAYGPAAMTAGDAAQCIQCDKDNRYFRLVLEETIQKQLVGLQPDRKTTLTAATDELLMDEQEGTIRIRRHQSRLRVKPFDSKQLQEMLGRIPEVGENVSLKGSSLLPFKVLAIKGPAVIVEFQLDPARPFPTPFGPAAIESSDDKEFWIRINPALGHLVRSGGLIGRVVAFDDDFITMDYRHPFGYEQLQCEVTVSGAHVRIEAAQNRLSKAGQ